LIPVSLFGRLPEKVRYLGSQ